MLDYFWIGAGRRHHNTRVTATTFIVYVVQILTKDRPKYTNKVLKQLKQIGLEFDEETGAEQIIPVTTENEQEETTSYHIDLESVVDETLQAISANMDDVEDDTLSDWDPMKTSFEQKNFNTYQQQKYNDNFVEKHVAVPRPDGYKISPTKVGSEEVRLYISNIPLSLTEDGMKNLFGSVGSCSNVKRCRPRDTSSNTTFGFVTYKSVRDAETAIRKYNGFVFGGKQKLQVRLAFQKNSEVPDDVQQEKVIWGSNGHGSRSDLSDIPDESISITSSHQPVVADIKNDVDKKVEKIAEGSHLDSVVISEPKKRPRLYVQGLKVGTSDIELKRLFDKFGPTFNCIVTPAKSNNQATTFGFVSYETIKEADKAVDYFHDYIYKENQLSVTYSNQSAAEYGRKIRMTEDDLFYEQLYNENPFQKHFSQGHNDLSNYNLHQEKPTISPEKSPTVTKTAVNEHAGSTEDISHNNVVTLSKELSPKNGDVCVYCFSPGASKKCARCHSPYCNRECQSNDWPTHKVICDSTATMSPISSSLMPPVKVTRASYVCDIPPRENLNGDVKLLFAVFRTDLTVSGIAVCKSQRHYAESLVAMETSFRQCNEMRRNVDLNDVNVGLLIVAMFTDQDWGRAVVKSTPLSSELSYDSVVDIHFIDNGLDKQEQIKNLTYLASDCLSLPKQEGCFVLSGLESVADLSYHNSVCATLNDYVEGKALTVVFEGESSAVILKCDGENLNEYIITNFIETIKMNGHSALSTIKRRPSCSDAIRGMMLPDLPVQPFPDVNEFQLCVTEVVSPHLFYGQLMHDAALQGLQQVTELLYETFVNVDAAPPFTPKINEICVAKFSEDGCWYRASIVQYDTDMSTARVSFVDYGNKAEVETSNLRCINEALLNFPRYAIKFSLNLQPSNNNAWPDNVIDFLKSSLLNKLSTIRCKKVKDDEMVCDVLLDHGSASLVESLQSMMVSTVERVMLTDLPKQDPLEEGKQYDAIATNVNSPNDFHAWVGDLKSITEQVQAITLELTEKTDTTSSYSPLVDEVCAVFHEDYQEWYRAVVLCIKSSSATVQLIDYGNRLEVKLHCVCSLPVGDCFKLPARSTPLSLYGLKSASGSWNKDAINMLKNKVELQRGCCIIGDDNKDLFSVRWLTTDGDDVADQLTSQFGSLLELNDAVHSIQTRRFYVTDLPYFKPRDSDLDILVTYVKDPWLFYGQVVKEENITAVSTISVSLAELGDYSSKAAYTPELNEVCAGFAELYNEWYRVAVVSLSSAVADVFLLDYGESMEIPLSHLQPLPLAVADIPTQAVSFCLHGVAPSNGVMWDATTCTKFSEQILLQKISIHKVSTNDDVIKVKVAVNGEDIADSLLSNNFARSSSPQSIIQKPQPSSLVETQRKYYVTDLPYFKPRDSDFDILVTYVKDPWLFYGQVVKEENITAVSTISVSLAELGNYSSKAEYTPELNEVCAGFAELYNEWYRVAVVSLSSAVADVFLLDYGESMEIPLSHLQPLPLAVADIPTQAVSFCLHGVAPSNGVMWDATTCTKFGEQILLQKISIHKVSTNDDVIKIKVAVNGENIADSLLSNNFARSSSPQSIIQKPQPSSLVETQRKYYVTDLPYFKPSDSDFDILVTYVKDPWLFYGQVVKEENITAVSTISVSLAELGDYSSKAEYTPELNEVCAGFAELYSEWYRVAVVSLSSAVADVFLLDYGESMEMPLSHMQPLPSVAADIPTQAVAFCLHGVAPNNEDVWTSEASAKFSELTLLQKISVHEVSTSGDVIEITAAVSGQDVGDILISSKFASCSTPQSFTQKPPTSAVVVPVLPARIMDEHIPKLNLPSERTSLFVVNICSPSNFQCQLAQVENIQQLDDICNQLTLEFEHDNPEEKYEPVVGEICAGFFVSFDQFFRVKVNRIDGDTIHVISIDYGNEEVISLTDIRRLPEKYAKLEQQALHMSLYNIASSSPDDAWSGECVKYFTETFLNKVCYCTVKERTADHFFVTLSTDVVSDVNQEFITRGYAVGPQPEIHNEKPPVGVSEIDISDSFAAELDCYTKLPAQNVPGECKIVISHTESVNRFFAQLCVQDMATKIYELTLQMCTYCEEHELKSYKPSINELCCALDADCWYRAFVKQVDESSAVVVFIDYGNDRELKFDELRPVSKDFLTMPSLAVCLSLHNPNSVPITGTAIKCFREKTENKLLSMKLIAKHSSSYEVQLCDDESGEDIAKCIEYTYKKEIQTKSRQEEQQSTEQPNKSDESSESFAAQSQPQLTVYQRQETKQTNEEKSPVVNKLEQVSKEKKVVEVKTNELLLTQEDFKSASLVTKLVTIQSESVDPPFVNEKEEIADINGYGDVEDEIALLPEAKYEPITKIVKSTVVDSKTKDDLPKIFNDTSEESTNAETSRFVISSLPVSAHALDSVSMKMGVAHLSSQPVQLYVTHVVSPHLVYAVIADAQSLEEVEKISEQIVEENECDLDVVRAGSLCSVKDEHLKWRRAIVTSVEETNCTVFAIDHGFTSNIPQAELKPLNRKFTKLPAQAIPLKLMTVKPKDGTGAWSEEAIDYFKGIIDGETIKVLPKFKEGVVMNVKMKMAATGESVDQLFEEYATVFQPIIPKEITESAKPKQVLRGVPFGAVLKVISIQPAPTDGPFQAIVTCAVSPRLFYVQLYNEERIIEVDALSDKLKDLYEETSECDNVFTPGQLCVVKYHDNLWYRAFLMECRVDEKMVIWLIDYGIKSRVDRKCLRPLPDDMKALPAQAVTMQLQYITPSGTSPNYSTEAIKRFKSMVEGKLMNFKLVKIHDVINRVVMHDTQSGMDISEKLVDEGLAEFIFNKHKSRESVNASQPREWPTPFRGTDFLRDARGGGSKGVFRGHPRGLQRERVPPHMDRRNYFNDYEDMPHDYYVKRFNHRMPDHEYRQNCYEDSYYNRSYPVDRRSQFCDKRFNGRPEESDLKPRMSERRSSSRSPSYSKTSTRGKGRGRMLYDSAKPGDRSRSSSNDSASQLNGTDHTNGKRDANSPINDRMLQRPGSGSTTSTERSKQRGLSEESYSQNDYNTSERRRYPGDRGYKDRHSHSRYHYDCYDDQHGSHHSDHHERRYVERYGGRPRDSYNSYDENYYYDSSPDRYHVEHHHRPYPGFYPREPKRGVMPEGRGSPGRHAHNRYEDF
ncbi:uncharacterized protein LOC130645350 isoform X2 [Hydractinia symbiolongicarpus]|uniref:uncharacterized protein LOC130645350 isoform X2 n=1 Tax=Hydractinia symbiolongicarpus TaxID=13093 RepID=UPI00254ACCFB|nr:uncharacterized protein LOC130645350 isoform X2 [Hydractinia symbiolongicarpus]